MVFGDPPYYTAWSPVNVRRPPEIERQPLRSVLGVAAKLFESAPKGKRRAHKSEAVVQPPKSQRQRWCRQPSDVK